MDLDVLNNLRGMILTTIQTAIDNYQPREWMSLKEGASYAGVSYNTFINFRKMGLEVTEIHGIKRVSKSAIDSFFHQHSF